MFARRPLFLRHSGRDGRAGGLMLDGCAKKPLDAASVAQSDDMSLGNPRRRG